MEVKLALPIVVNELIYFVKNKKPVSDTPYLDFLKLFEFSLYVTSCTCKGLENLKKYLKSQDIELVVFWDVSTIALNYKGELTTIKCWRLVRGKPSSLMYYLDYFQYRTSKIEKNVEPNDVSQPFSNPDGSMHYISIMARIKSSMAVLTRVACEGYTIDTINSGYPEFIKKIIVCHGNMCVDMYNGRKVGALNVTYYPVDDILI